MPTLSRPELNAFVVALRTIVDETAPDRLPPISTPFDAGAEITALRVFCEETLASATNAQLIGLRGGSSPTMPEQATKAEKDLARRVTRAEKRLFNGILIRRGAAPAPANPAPVDLEADAMAIRLVLLLLLAGVSDKAVIEAHRDAHARWVAMGENGIPEDDPARLSLDYQLLFYRTFMDSSGVTERFIANMPRGALN
jgi:hypothetical protein